MIKIRKQIDLLTELIREVLVFYKRPGETTVNPEDEKELKRYLEYDKKGPKPEGGKILDRLDSPEFTFRALEKVERRLYSLLKAKAQKKIPIEDWMLSFVPVVFRKVPKDPAEKKEFLDFFELRMLNIGIKSYELFFSAEGQEYVTVKLDCLDAYPSRRTDFMDFLTKFFCKPIYQTLKNEGILENRGKNYFEWTVDCQNLIAKKIFPLINRLAWEDRLKNHKEYKAVTVYVILSIIKYIFREPSTTDISTLIGYLTGRAKSELTSHKNMMVKILMSDEQGGRLERHLLNRIRVLCEGCGKKFIDKLREDHRFCEDCHGTKEPEENKGSWGGYRSGAGRPPKFPPSPSPGPANP